MCIGFPGSYEIKVVRSVLAVRGKGPGIHSIDRALMRGVNLLKIRRGAAENVYRMIAP